MRPAPYPIDFAQALRRHLPGGVAFPSAEAVAAMELHARLLLQWNPRFHLTSISDPVEIVRRHFAESLAASPFIAATARVLDVGSGGGFPGLPLHLARGGQGGLVLLESSENKATFLETVIRRTGVPNARVAAMHVRGAADAARLEEADAALIRAVGGIPRLFSWLPRVLAPRGVALFFAGSEGARTVREEGQRHGFELLHEARLSAPKGPFLMVLRRTD